MDVWICECIVVFLSSELVSFLLYHYNVHFWNDHVSKIKRREKGDLSDVFMYGYINCAHNIQNSHFTYVALHKRMREGAKSEKGKRRALCVVCSL